MKEGISKVYGTLQKKCILQKSPIHKKGVFANEKIAKRRKIGSLSGILISTKLIPNSFSKNASISIVELSNNQSLDSRQFKNILCFVNHSCSPNCFSRVFNTNVEIYALRDIKKGEELTIDYAETHHDGNLACRCGSKNCKRWL